MLLGSFQKKVPFVVQTGLNILKSNISIKLHLGEILKHL